MRFAVVGCGVIGDLHSKTIKSLPDTELAVVVDEVADRAAAYGERFGVESSSAYDEVLRRPDIDTVAVCVPSGLHTELGVAALKAGKNVIIEKPLDVTPEAADAIIAASEESDRVATVISQHRFDPASQVVAEALRQEKFGRITSGSADIAWWRSQGYYDSGDWRGTWKLDGGGALMNQGVHSVDLLTWFLGQPVEVFAWTDALAHERIEVEDTAVATIRFESGALGTVHGTTAAYPGLTARIQVLGAQGSAVIENDKLTYFHSAVKGADAPAYGAGAGDNQAADVLPGEVAGGVSASADPKALSDAHTIQYRDFLDAVAQGRDPLVTVRQAARTFDVIWAIYASARSGAPVRITPRKA
ncbi:MAG TPA: Gfo/Idh/MocA family oxidoreductase [Mycobacteriales bacterium]|nr:Gfo/Idh/MocA family oxidoreductase [Mycobacteriales bacterium]